MSRTYLPSKRSRRNEGSSATAAFQARRLIPFLVRQKTKGHLEGYEGRKVWQDHTRRKTIRASRAVGPGEKRGDATGRRGGGRRLSDIFLRKRPRFIPPEARYPRSRMPNWLLNSIPSACLFSLLLHSLSFSLSVSRARARFLFLSLFLLLVLASTSRSPSWECYEKPRTSSFALVQNSASIEPSRQEYRPQFRTVPTRTVDIN